MTRVLLVPVLALLIAAAAVPQPRREASPTFEPAQAWTSGGSVEAAYVFQGHNGPIRGAAFSPLGDRVVTVSADRTARVWRIDGRGQTLVLSGHEGDVTAVAFSPDGTRVATGSVDETVRVWKLGSEDPPLVLRGHQGTVTGVVFSHDGERIASASMDRTARVWAADGTGDPVVLRGHILALSGIDFSPDGSEVVTGSRDGVRVWKADGTVEPVVLGQRRGVQSVAFGPDGRWVVTSGIDLHAAEAWHADGRGEPIVFQGGTCNVTAAALSPDGSRVVTACWDGRPRLWKADGTGTPVPLPGQPHKAWVTALAFNPAGSRVVSASSADPRLVSPSSSGDPTIRIWPVEGAGGQVVLSGPVNAAGLVAFSPDGSRVLADGTDRAVRVWRSDGTGAPVVLVHPQPVSRAAFSSDGARVLTLAADGARVWSLAPGGEPRLSVPTCGATSWALSADGERVAEACAQGRLIKLRRTDGGGATVGLKEHRGAVTALAFRADGALLASGSNDRTVQVWRTDGTGEPVMLPGHEMGVSSVVFSPDGSRLASVAGDHRVRLWNVDGTGEAMDLGRSEPVSFSANGARVLIGDRGGVELWRTDRPAPPLVFDSRPVMPLSAVFSPEGSRVLVASSEGTVQVWGPDGRRTIIELRDPAGQRPVLAVFSVDRTRLVTVTPDSTARVYRLPRLGAR